MNDNDYNELKELFGLAYANAARQAIRMGSDEDLHKFLELDRLILLEPARKKQMTKEMTAELQRLHDGAIDFEINIRAEKI